MLFARIAAATLLLAPAPVATATPTARTDVKVQCLLGMGTGFRVGPHLVVSVAHVTNLPVCAVEGRMIVAQSAPGQDFSVIVTEGEGPSLKADCDGFIEGRRYIARGFARNEAFETEVELIGTGKKDGQFSVLKGMFTVIPGMSGGPILDAVTGKVVGTVNVFNFPSGMTGSVALKDTSLC